MQCASIPTLKVGLKFFLRAPKSHLATKSTQLNLYFSHSFSSHFQVSECPCLGIHLYILKTVLKDVLGFFISVSALILGFAFSFHLMIRSNDYSSPISALTSLLAFILGHFGTEKNPGHLPGTSEILFVISYVLLSIGAMNILIGLCIANIKDILMQKEDFKLGQMILNNIQIEETILAFAQFFQKFKCCSTKLVKMASILDDQENCKYLVFPFQSSNENSGRKYRRSTVLPLRFGNAISVPNMAVFQETEDKSGVKERIATSFTLPGN